MEKMMSDIYVWLGVVSTIILTVIGITILIVIIYMYIKAKPQKPAVVAVLGILAIICVVNYRWDFVGFEIGDKVKFYVPDVLRDEKHAKLKKDSSIINSTATVSEIEKAKGIDKPTPIPVETIKNLKDFVYYLTQTKALNQYSFNYWDSKGTGEFLDGKYEKAINFLKKALSNAPDDASASYIHNYLGAAYANSGNDGEALKNYIKAIEFKPDNPLAHLNKARIHIRSGKIDVAENEIEMAKDLFKEGKVNEGKKPSLEKEIELVEKKLEDSKKEGKGL
ncbi:MAG: tetratricopeptide repeat protein [Candidatus Omnitrophica bacterium]|nr:tetratricopeptide repeat protein [Candidatus Omnitrophota bacterium]